MSPQAKKILGSVLTAAATAGVAYLAPQYREAALAVFGFVLGALNIPRPGDTKAGE